MAEQGIKEFKVPIPEGGSAMYSAQILKEDGQPLLLADITSATMTLEDVASGTIINARNESPILNQNGGTFTNAVFQMRLSSQDTAALGTARIQGRAMTLKVGYTGGGVLHRLILFYIQSLRRVGTPP